jgi:hypothetical protein
MPYEILKFVEKIMILIKLLSKTVQIWEKSDHKYVKTISDQGISPDSAFRSTHYSTYGRLLRWAPIGWLKPLHQCVGIEQMDISVVDTRVKFRRKIVKNGEQKLPISEKIEI